MGGSPGVVMYRASYGTYKKHYLPLLQVSFCLMPILSPIPSLHQDLVTSHPLNHLLCNLLGEECNVGQDPAM